MLLLASPLLYSPLLYAQSPEPNFGLPPGSPASAVPITIDDSTPWTPDEDYLTEPQCDCEPVQLYSSRFAVDLTLADFELDDGEARYWTTKPTGVRRVEFSIENDEGYGLRCMLWSLDSEGDLDVGSLDVRVATYYLDGYRRYIEGRGELLVGGGLAYGNVKIDSSFVDPVHRFSGLGGSLVGEGFYAFLRFDKTDIGAVGRARLALLAPLEDNFGDSQAMWVDELGIGLELRRRWGKFDHKMWFLRVSRDFQHWSDADAPFAADQRVEGTTFTVGFAW
jgi:hypothetical protein